MPYIHSVIPAMLPGTTCVAAGSTTCASTRPAVAAKNA